MKLRRLLRESSFWRLPKNIISGPLYQVSKKARSFDSRMSAGNDLDMKDLDTIIKMYQDIKKKAKKFNSNSDVKDTIYEAAPQMKQKPEVNDLYKIADSLLKIAGSVNRKYGHSADGKKAAKELIKVRKHTEKTLDMVNRITSLQQ